MNPRPTLANWCRNHSGDILPGARCPRMRGGHGTSGEFGGIYVTLRSPPGRFRPGSPVTWRLPDVATYGWMAGS
ncbi:hypothetical protein ZHAS_00008694 [Anopheles sinensis]|uniref:Uncharacterized protein n=1 Tax=Anopheles sinensis TaxID=74873 RepID=A0A084VT53_ANOSI|nr:hypothetical protein ZHAS_00008694 [Anopheles sinensis]